MKSVQNIVLFLSIFLFIGLVYIAFFNVYQTDDYIFSYSTRKFGLLENIKNYYIYWGGRYFGYTINMLNPLSYDQDGILPRIYPIFLILTFISVLALNFKQFFAYSFKESLIKALLLFFFYTILLVSLPEHYYWITGANVYFLPVILSGLSQLFYRKFKESGNKIWFFLTALFLAILMGSNEILELIILSILVFFYTQNKSKGSKILLIIGCTGFLVSFLAPGNFNRMIESHDRFLLKWTKRIVFFGLNSVYTSIKVILILPLFIKVFGQELNEIRKKIDLKKTCILWLISFLPLLFLGFIINAIGRQFESIIFFYLLTFSVVVSFKFVKIKKFWWISLLLIFLPETDILPSKYANFNIDYNLNNVIKETFITDLKKYDDEIDIRIKTIRNSKQDSLVLDKIKTIPKILYFDEMSSENEEKKYVNDQLEKYFDKKYIRVK